MKNMKLLVGVIIEYKTTKTLQYETKDEFSFLLDNERKQCNQS